MFNQGKKYNQLLDVNSMGERQRTESLKGIFDRDIQNKELYLNNKRIYPSPNNDGAIKMDLLFSHLTTKIVDKKSRHREYDRHRSIRLHWIKYHIDNIPNILVFSAKSKGGKRTYIYDQNENYAIILEPLRSGDAYYLLTAYPAIGVGEKQFRNAYKRRLEVIL